MTHFATPCWKAESKSLGTSVFIQVAVASNEQCVNINVDLALLPREAFYFRRDPAVWLSILDSR